MIVWSVACLQVDHSCWRDSGILFQDVSLLEPDHARVGPKTYADDVMSVIVGKFYMGVLGS